MLQGREGALPAGWRRERARPHTAPRWPSGERRGSAMGFGRTHAQVRGSRRGTRGGGALRGRARQALRLALSWTWARCCRRAPACGGWLHFCSRSPRDVPMRLTPGPLGFERPQTALSRCCHCPGVRRPLTASAAVQSGHSKTCLSRKLWFRPCRCLTRCDETEPDEPQPRTHTHYTCAHVCSGHRHTRTSDAHRYTSAQAYTSACTRTSQTLMHLYICTQHTPLHARAHTHHMHTRA